MNLVKKNFPLIILSLIPLSFVIGPFLTELFINFLIIFFLIEIFKKKEFSFLKNNIFIYFFIFYLFLIFSHLNSEYVHQNSLNVFSYIRFIILPFAIFFILDKNQYNLKICYIILSITIFIVVADGIYQFFFDKNIIGFPKYRLDRVSGFFKDDLVLGSYVMRLLPLLIGLTLFFKDEFKLNFLNVILIFLSLILIIFSGERASFFMIMIALTLIFFYINLSLYVKSFFILLIFSTLR